jgi:hypothetical protein
MRGAAAHIHVIYDVSATAGSPLIAGARFTRPAAAGGDCRPGGVRSMVCRHRAGSNIGRRWDAGRPPFAAGSVEWWILLDALSGRVIR